MTDLMAAQLSAHFMAIWFDVMTLSVGVCVWITRTDLWQHFRLKKMA